MHQKVNRLKRIAAIVVAVQLVVLAFLWLGLGWDMLIPFILVGIEAAVLFYLFDQFDKVAEEQSIGVKNALGSTAQEAYLTGGMGLLIYDDDYVVTWMSELFAERGIDRVGYKLLTWVPEADDLISGKSDAVTITLDDRIYEIRRKEDAQIIFFRDITELSTYKDKYSNEHVVIGMLSFDNYEESTQYLDEGETSAVNMAVRTPVNEYCSQHGILARRLNNHNRYLLVLNEKIFNDLVADRFSILNKVRKAAQKMDVSITLSMAFARGTSDFLEMDEMVSNLMDLVAFWRIILSYSNLETCSVGSERENILHDTLSEGIGSHDSCLVIVFHGACKYLRCRSSIIIYKNDYGNIYLMLSI